MPLLPGMQIFQPQEQTTDFQQPGESYWSWLKKRIADAIAISTQSPNVSNNFPNLAAGGNMAANPVQVDQNFKPIPGQQQPSFLSQVDNWVGQLANLSPLKNVPPYAHRINEWAQMKTTPNPPQGQQMPSMIPPETIQGAGPAIPAPMPQPLVPQPAPQQQETQQVAQQMPFPMPQGQNPMNFQDYWKSMQEMQPQREKTWMDSPLYPFSMAMLGMGQNLMTPPRLRGFNQNTFAPMMQALAMQAQNKTENDRRALFEKAVASYPHFVQATRPMKQDWNFAWNPETKQFMPVPGTIHNLPQQEKAQYGITVGPGGSEQIIQLPPGNYTTLPSAKQKEIPPQVVPIMDDQGNINFTPVPQGAKATSPMRYQPSLLQQMQQMNQKGGGQQQTQGPLIKATNTRTGQVEYITVDEARRRGMR